MKITKPQKTLQGDNYSFVLEDTYKLIRGNITFGSMKAGDVGQNIKGVPVQVTTPGVADTQFIITHNLNEIPTGFLVVTKNKAGDFYQSAASTKTQMFLKCSGVSVIAIIFVLG